MNRSRSGFKFCILYYEYGLSSPSGLTTFGAMAALRIAILKADVPMPTVIEKFGDYGPIFRRLLKAGERRAQLPERDLELTDYDVVVNPQYPKLEDVDAVLITGSSR